MRSRADFPTVFVVAVVCIVSMVLLGSVASVFSATGGRITDFEVLLLAVLGGLCVAGLGAAVAWINR